MIDLSIFTTAEAWLSLITLIFLEIVLGVDNIVFITVITNRLPPEQQHIGRKLGLLGAMVSRIIFLCVASYFVHMVNPLFEIDLGFYSHGFSVRDIILLVGGAYLIYKGISELRSVMALTDLKVANKRMEDGQSDHRIGLGQAIGTIMVMDVVFSIDSVITATGLAEHLIIMIIAVMTAVFVMMIFIDVIANFIEEHVEMKILALAFIVAIGALLFFESLGISSGIEVIGLSLEKLMVYFAMLFSVVIVVLLMHYRENVKRYHMRLDPKGEDTINQGE